MAAKSVVSSCQAIYDHAFLYKVGFCVFSLSRYEKQGNMRSSLIE